MPTYRFQVVRRTAEQVGYCPVCGKRVRRSTTFENTVNPYNRNVDGSVKTPAEVAENVKKLVKEWVPDFTHGRCREVPADAQ